MSNDIPQSVRKEVYERSDHKCEFYDQGHRCFAPAQELHHLLPRGRGGLHVPSNLAHLCVPHHQWIGANVRIATSLGWLRVPMAQPSFRLFLCDKCLNVAKLEQPFCEIDMLYNERIWSPSRVMHLVGELNRNIPRCDCGKKKEIVFTNLAMPFMKEFYGFKFTP